MKLNLIEQMAYRYREPIKTLFPEHDHPCDRNLFFKHRNVLHRRYDARIDSFKRACEVEALNWIKACGYKVGKKDEFYVTKIEDIVTLIVVNMIGQNDAPMTDIQVIDRLKKTATVSQNGRPLAKAVLIEISTETFQTVMREVEFDQSALDEWQARADKIEALEEMPPKNQSHCHGCEFIDFCNSNALANVNCRTCASYSHESQSCPYGDKPCSKHAYHPDYIKLIGFDVESADPVTMTIDYGKFSNGEEGSMTSEVMHKAYGVQMLQSEALQELLNVFDGKLENVKRLSE